LCATPSPSPISSSTRGGNGRGAAESPKFPSKSTPSSEFGEGKEKPSEMEITIGLEDVPTQGRTSFKPYNTSGLTPFNL